MHSKRQWPSLTYPQFFLCESFYNTFKLIIVQILIH